IWVIAINGALVGLEGIVQRLEGSGRLLFLVKPRVNLEAVTQFGPYAYRANAGSLFNLIWPVCIGAWWTLRRYSVQMSWGYHCLLACGLVIAACPLMTTSRGAALITVLLIVTSSGYLLGSLMFLRTARARQGSKFGMWGWAVALVVAVGIGL